MKWSRRIRPAMFVLGAALVAATLLGAKALTAGGHAEPQKSANPAGGGKGGGPVVLGTVDSDPSPVWYGLPPVIQSGTVEQVFVKDGQEVNVGDKLYTFDTRMQQRKLEGARAVVAAAQSKVGEAQEGVKQHQQKVEVAKLAVEAAEQKELWYGRLHTVVKNKVEEGLKTSGYPQEEWPARLNANESLYEAGVKWTTAKTELALKKRELAALEAADPQVLVRVAQADVLKAETQVEEVKEAIEKSTVRAYTAGTVEQVKISAGSTLGIGTRDPALWIIPGNSRIVRAEVEADFAHRVGPELKDKEVVVYDHTNPSLTYKGIVRRVGGAFLPKQTDGLVPNETRAIPVIIDVPDPNPSGKPPLRVGQRVRVNLGQ